MQEYKVPWGQWYEQSFRTLTFPDEWEVHFQEPNYQEELSDDEIQQALDKPIGTEELEKLAKGKKSACIIIDDISRPTPGDRLLPIVIKKLVNAGISYTQIKVLVALGGHRPMTRQEMKIKVGEWVLDHVQVINHFAFSPDLVTIPNENQTIRINRNYVEADLKIAVGCIVPHTLAGFSGGAKAVIPGIGGIETLESNHTLVFADKSKSMSFKTSTCDPDNAMRKNMEEIVGKVGLDFIVNVVLNSRMKVADVYAGHFVKAHRKACLSAMDLLGTELVENADITVTSAYPKDTEYSQIATCFAVLGHYKEQCVAKDGTLVAMTAASEGAGFHSLFGPGMSLFSPHDDNMPPLELKDKELFILSDGVKQTDIKQFYRGETPNVYPSWQEVLEKLKKKYAGRKPVVAVYPMGAVSIGRLLKEEGRN